MSGFCVRPSPATAPLHPRGCRRGGLGRGRARPRDVSPDLPLRARHVGAERSRRPHRRRRLLAQPPGLKLNPDDGTCSGCARSCMRVLRLSNIGTARTGAFDNCRVAGVTFAAPFVNRAAKAIPNGFPLRPPPLILQWSGCPSGILRRRDHTTRPLAATITYWDKRGAESSGCLRPGHGTYQPPGQNTPDLFHTRIA